MSLTFETRIIKVISGGQTGADRAGLDAARDAGITTGGHAPLHYRTQGGNDYTLKELGLIEDPSFAYQPRTQKNVQNSDGTLIIGLNVNSPGCGLTQRYCSKHGKPQFLVKLSTDGVTPFTAQQLSDAVAWVQENNIAVLNIAGNREAYLEQRSLVYGPTFRLVSQLLGQINGKPI